MTRGAFAALILAVAAAGQATPETRPEARIVALDHLESKGVTAWITAAPGGERSLVVARLGAPVATRLVARGLRDVVLHGSGRHVCVLIERRGRVDLEEIAVEGDGESSPILTGLVASTSILGRSAEEVHLLAGDAIYAVGLGGATPIFRRDDPAIAMVAMDSARTIVATVRGGEVELVSPGGEIRGGLGPGTSPAFLEDGRVTFVRKWSDASPVSRERGPVSSEIVIADAFAPEDQPQPILTLAGEISSLRNAGEGSLLFRHAPGRGVVSFWLLHLASGVIRPMDPAERGALKAAMTGWAPQAACALDPSAATALPEPETEASGFFYTDDDRNEYRTGYEESGWIDERSPDEARIHRRLLDKFLDGIQWPLRREGAYEPLIASDDEPLRPHSSIPHLGLDLGSRLVHSSTGTVAFHVAGAQVFPLYRGGTIHVGRTVVLRAAGGALARRYPILQEVVLHDSGYGLRVHIAYEHVDPYDGDALVEDAAADALPARPTLGDEPLGELIPAENGMPHGGWVTCDPVLRAAGIAKGNHVHVGIGGIFESFNRVGNGSARKLAWYRERLYPALKRSFGPK